MDVNQALSDLKDIQQLIQDKYLKQFPEEGSLDRPYFSEYIFVILYNNIFELHVNRLQK